MSFQTLYTIIRGFLLATLFARDPLLTKIENMEVETFYRSVKCAGSIETTGIDVRIYALFSYKDPLVKTLVWNMKFRKNKRCFELAGILLHEEILALLADLRQFENFDEPLILPVPLSSKRRRERGYNQSELLAREIIKLNKEKYFTVIENTLERKHTPPQTSLSRNERKKNLKGIFTVKKEKVMGRNIIILDDVVTTGTTISEIAKTLRKAGVRKMIGIALAH